jgi:hypothetical protein
VGHTEDERRHEECIKSLLRKPERKSPFGRRWEDIIKVDLID